MNYRVRALNIKTKEEGLAEFKKIGADTVGQNIMVNKILKLYVANYFKIFYIYFVLIILFLLNLSVFCIHLIYVFLDIKHNTYLLI